MSYQTDSVSPAVAAQSMLSQHWDERLPVDPRFLARQVGLVTRATPHSRYSGWFDPDQCLIEYNGNEAPVRQRFTIAHELGHYALQHGPRPRDTAESFSSRNSDPLERAANQFAAELLMPADAVRQIVNSGRFATLDDIAKVFKVSKVAMSYRMTNLGLGFFS